MSVDDTSSAARPDSRTARRLIALLGVVVIAILISFAFFASSLCITFLLAGFLAILCDPIPTYFERWYVPRSLSSAVIVVFGVALLAVAVRASYSRVGTFIDDVPEYAGRLREILQPLQQNIEQIQKTAGTLNPAPLHKRIPEVRINQTPTWPPYLIRGVGTVWGAVLVGAVVPFLMFFMLARKSHLFNWLNSTFGANVDVPQFADRLGKMVRGFAVGNLAIGAALAAVTVTVLLALKLPGAVVLGIASAFLNLVPFLGAILAAAIPILPALVQSNGPGPLVIILCTVFALHFVSVNLLIPKFIGSRVNIGPVAATVGLLFWGWLWGIMGILLAVPLTAFVKLVSDCHPSLIHISNLLAETPHPLRPWPPSATSGCSSSIPFLRKPAPSDARD